MFFFLANAHFFKIGFKEVLLLPLFFALAFGIASFLAGNKQPFRRYYMLGLACKLLGGFMFGMVYIYYYGGGDTTRYFTGASNFFRTFIGSPAAGLHVLSNAEMFPEIFDNSPTVRTVQQLAGVVNLFSFNSFWICTLWFSVLSFAGIWKMFRAFSKVYPTLHREIAIACLFVPGVFFWSSGLMKDTLAVFGVGLMTGAVVEMFMLREKNLVKNGLLLALGFAVVMAVKAYIVIALCGSFALYFFIGTVERIKNPFLKVAAFPFLGTVMAAGLYLGYGTIQESLQKFALESVIETAQEYNDYHHRISDKKAKGNRTGSDYDLGVDFSSPAGLVAAFPLAVNVTYFRPYLWETRNPVMLLSAAESAVILYFALFLLFKMGLFGLFRGIMADAHVLMCLTFSLGFGFAVGLSSGNFGTLVRYKTVSVPFFLLAGIIMWYNFKRQKAKKQGRKT